MTSVIIGLSIPFLGTVLGSACVFFMRKQMNDTLQRVLMGFAAGVMVAASVWSLLIPSIDMAKAAGTVAYIPAFLGFSIGIVFLYVLDRVIPHLHVDSSSPEGPKTKLHRTTMLVFAVTLHNIPEGMAAGVVWAGIFHHSVSMSAAAALVLSIGLAIQNFPEGAIISMPLREEGNGKLKSFGYGALSGVVEPIAGIITILVTGFITTALPYLLAFASGAMIYVVVEELIPTAARDEKTDMCTMGFAAGFALMMVLDIAFS